jgi:PAS domain S-box-containing protein
VVKPYDASEIVLRVANLVETRLLSLEIRERGQEELHQSEERFRLMFEKSGVGMVLTTTNRILLQVNAAFCTLIGRNEKEIVEHVATEFTHPDDIEKTVSPSVEAREDGVHVIDQEKRYLRKDDAIVWAHVTAVLHFDEKAEPLYFIAMVEDITARKQAEDALRASEKHFRTMFEKTPVGMSVVSPELCWLRVNPALCDFLGYSEPELTGRPITEFTHPDDIEKTLSERSAAEAQGPHVFHLEKRYLRKDGAIVWREVSAVLHFDESGQALHFLWSRSRHHRTQTLRNRALACEGRMGAILRWNSGSYLRTRHVGENFAHEPDDARPVRTGARKSHRP